MLTLFTVSQANAALEKVRPMVESIVRCKSQMGQLVREARLLHQRGVQRDPVARRALERKIARLESLEGTIRQLVTEIRDMGASVKDLDIGLVDFPAIIEGQPAYLCWMLGEREVSHWHLVDDGFRGRRPLPGTQAEQGS